MNGIVWTWKLTPRVHASRSRRAPVWKEYRPIAFVEYVLWYFDQKKCFILDHWSESKVDNWNKHICKNEICQQRKTFNCRNYYNIKQGILYNDHPTSSSSTSHMRHLNFVLQYSLLGLINVTVLQRQSLKPAWC